MHTPPTPLRVGTARRPPGREKPLRTEWLLTRSLVVMA